jgi:hypothetical protein
MNNNRNHPHNAYLASLLVTLTTVSLIFSYFSLGDSQHPATWRELLQGLSGNIIATTISFLAVYVFIDRIDALGSSKSTYEWLINQIVYQLEEKVLLRMESKDLNDNSYFQQQVSSLKSDLALQIQQMGKEVGNSVNTKLDLDSNELYGFYGLLGAKVALTFQNFRVSRDASSTNVNAVSHLWADTMYGNSINSKVVINEVNDPFLRIEFQCFEDSWGCNIAIRPQDEKAIECKTGEFNYLCFQARIPEETLHNTDLLDNVGIAIRIANGKYQQWDYGNRAGEYMQFQVKNDGKWGVICIDIQDKSKWSHFSSDGNNYVNDSEKNNADLSIVSAVIIKVGKYQGRRGELGSGKGQVDIKDMKFLADPV